MSSRQSAKDAKLQNLGRMIREPILRWAWHSHAADRKKKRVVNSRRRRSLRKQMYGFAIKKFGRALRLADWDFETLETKPLCETQRPLRPCGFPFTQESSPQSRRGRRGPQRRLLPKSHFLCKANKRSKPKSARSNNSRWYEAALCGRGRAESNRRQRHYRRLFSK